MIIALDTPILLILLPVLATLFLCYAEIHYKFKLIPSRYMLQAPEILADVPRRLAPNRDLPVLILVKDAHRYPVRIEQVSVQISGGAGPRRVVTFTLNREITEAWWQRLLWVPRHHEDAGWRQVRVSFKIILAGKAQLFTSDNYPLTHGQPFRCYFAEDPLPAAPGFYTGDLHTHSNYTSDQVEFGAPLIAIVQTAIAMGHHFVAVTDHSYDLDDSFDDYLQNDPHLRKWQVFQSESRFFNTHLNDFVVIPGEEVSCGNARGQNVHLLVFNNRRFIPGAGDSGEKWLRTTPSLGLDELLREGEDACLFFAAHPSMPVPFLQRLLLRRNTWGLADYLHERLNGLQIWNASPSGMQNGSATWVRLLLQGQRKFIIAGSDAHGNFNRFRQIRMPHLFMHEHEDFHLFGQHRTLVYLNDTLSLERLLHALRCGAATITSGPFLGISGHPAPDAEIASGGEMHGQSARLQLQAYSTAEFGALARITLYRGDIGAAQESILIDEALPSTCFAFRAVLDLPPPGGSGSYYRAEVRCHTRSSLPIMAMTNPIWHTR